MRKPFFLTVLVLALWPTLSTAQTPDEIIEKHLAATGGRAALSKLTSRVVEATITMTMPIGNLSGTAEVYAKSPNKSRTLIKLDASAFGIPQVVNDQRFDGVNAYVIDSVQGDRDISGPQLDAMRNQTFPTLLFNYQDRGIAVALAGREKIADREAFILVLTPKSGPPIRLFIDTQSFMLVRTTLTTSAPEVGVTIEQVNDFSDFRDVDGVKVPFATKSSNQFQTVTGVVKGVKHNVDIDDKLFSKPTP